MGRWKDWQIAMIEDGYSDREITQAASRIKGTLADPLVKRLPAPQDRDDDNRHQDRQQ